MKRFLTLTFVVVLSATALLLGAKPAAAASPVYSPPKQYYLAVGDSLSFGYQQGKVAALAKASGTVDPNAINTGFVDDFSRMLRAVDPGIQTINLGCPGATSTDVVSTPGCTTYPYPLHYNYTGTQLQAAVTFIKAHPGQVSPITINIGGNDVIRLVAGCGGLTNLSCVVSGLPAVAGTLTQNLGTIVGTLRATAPDAEIILLNQYNPYALISPASNALALAFNKVYAGVADATGVLLADVFTPINATPPQPQTFCTLLLTCTELQDTHPTDAGYLVIGKTIWNVSGYNGRAGGFMVSFNSSSKGQGMVYFGTSCSGLVSVGTNDLVGSGFQHSVFVTGNDLPGTVGDNGIVPGVTYYYETVTFGPSGTQIDNNGGTCYSYTAAS